MSEHGQLREALMKIGTNGWSREHIMDAVLTVLDQQGWVSSHDTFEKDALIARLQYREMAEQTRAENAEAERDDWKRKHALVTAREQMFGYDLLPRVEAERDAALREAARYERLGEVASDQHGLPYAQWDDIEVPFGVPLYRRVTEGEE